VIDPEYVGKLIVATKIVDPKRIEICFKDRSELSELLTDLSAELLANVSKKNARH
jgi:hypothetical protein